MKSHVKWMVKREVACEILLPLTENLHVKMCVKGMTSFHTFSHHFSHIFH